MRSMAYSLPLPETLARQGWKVKIRDRERVEPPHATILHRTSAWRFGLRSAELLDRRPDPREVPCELIDEVRMRLEALRQRWDEMYPENPVAGAR
jgi:hypothetical protein